MKIGIVVAMNDEWTSVGEALENKTITTLYNRPLYLAKNDTNEVYIICSGVGKVAAAFATTLLISLFNVDILISSGVAGTTSPKLAIGDIMLSSKVVQYDVDTVGVGDPLGYISALKEVFVESDPSLISLFKLLLIENKINYDIGIIGSGDSFINDKERKDKIIETFGVSCFEMEYGGLSQVAKMENLPSIAIKAISDNADDKATNDYETNKNYAMKTLTKLFKAYFASLSL